MVTTQKQTLSFMARNNNNSFITALVSISTCFYSFIFILSTFSIISFLHSCRCYEPSCENPSTVAPQPTTNRSIDLLTYSSSWNRLTFRPDPPPELLKIAVFVKKWPQKSHAGGIERHALTLYLALAKRGHEIHVFTTNPENSVFPKYPYENLFFHLTKPTSGSYLDQSQVWEQFQAQNSSKPFDAVHTESVALMHTRSRHVPNLAVSWHGIAYETIHSDIIEELLRSAGTPRSLSLTERPMKVVEEVRFFQYYEHHVATCDHVGDVLKRVYMIPEERVHVILNGVDEEIFKPDTDSGIEFLTKFGVSISSKSLILGLSGRLVKDKGHPIMFEALNQMFNENPKFKNDVVVLVAGDGPWGNRYRELGSNIIVLGPLEQTQLAKFYNAIDVFVNPTLRAQGLDQTPLEAILSATPVLVTRLASVTGSVVVDEEMGYTFAPSVEALKKVVYRVWGEGRGELQRKGRVARERGLGLFAASKMNAAYERLFLCIASTRHCQFKE